MKWWYPGVLARKLPRLQARGRMMAELRAFFAEQGFLEVETPALQVSPGIEPHLTAFATTLEAPDGVKREMYLHTSPEFAMKKLLAGGMENIFQFARVFRNAERSETHHPEFTMLEWYRAGANYRDLMVDCEMMLRQVAEAAEGVFRRGEQVCDPGPAWQYLTVEAAFRTYADIDLAPIIGNPQAPDTVGLRLEAQRIGIRVDDEDDWDDLFFKIFLARIEPHLGSPVPTILYDYPLCMAALARAKPEDGRLAERFELYVCGLELANAFGELTDPDIQRARFQADVAAKQQRYGFAYPIDEEFLAALAMGLPDSAGIALGVDRLAMLVTGAQAIEQVLWAEVAGA